MWTLALGLTETLALTEALAFGFLTRDCKILSFLALALTLTCNFAFALTFGTLALSETLAFGALALDLSFRETLAFGFLTFREDLPPNLTCNLAFPEDFLVDLPLILMWI